jgi:hypothetical protein
MTANIVVVLVFDAGARRVPGRLLGSRDRVFPLACAEYPRTQNERRGRPAPLSLSYRERPCGVKVLGLRSKAHHPASKARMDAAVAKNPR